MAMTVDEYLFADLPEGYRYELVDGAIEISPLPDGVHEEAACALNRILMRHRRAHPDWIALVSFNSGVLIPGMERVREPDIAVYDRWETKGRRWSVWKEFTPILVVEIISPGQERRDYEDKREDYLKAGIREYWIVNPGDPSITVLTRAGQAWAENVHRPGEAFEAKCLPGLNVAVSDVLKTA